MAKSISGILLSLMIKLRPSKEEQTAQKPGHITKYWLMRATDGPQSQTKSIAIALTYPNASPSCQLFFYLFTFPLFQFTNKEKCHIHIDLFEVSMSNAQTQTT